MIGFFITLISVSELSTALTLNLCNAYAKSAANYSYVLGTFNLGLISSITF